MRRSQTKYEGPEAQKKGVFKEQREGMAAGAEGGRGEHGPAQDEFHRPQ